MPRNSTFASSREPLRTDESLDIINERTSGPFSFLNPTRAHFNHKALSNLSSNPSTKSLADANTCSSTHEDKHLSFEDEKSSSNIYFKWRSRDNRKGRHVLVIKPTSDSHTPATVQSPITPQPTSTLLSTLRGFRRMLTRFPYWNISYLVATIFTLGSVLWVFNAFFVWFPLVEPSTKFPTEIAQGGGITAFIGATIFEIGSVLLMFEAVNENRAGCFGWAVEQVWEGEQGRLKVREDAEGCAHHHTNKRNLVGKGDGMSHLSFSFPPNRPTKYMPNRIQCQHPPLPSIHISRNPLSNPGVGSHPPASSAPTTSTNSVS